MKKPSNKKKKIMILSLCGILAAALALFIIWGNSALALTHTTVSSSALPSEFEGFKIAHISDLHNCEYGKDNTKLLELLKQSKPDIIAVTGDLIDSVNTDIDCAIYFMKKAVEIAPCYYVSGNNEWGAECYDTLKSELQSLGVTVLDDKAVTFEKNGQFISIAGVSDPRFVYEDEPSAEKHINGILEELLENVSGYTLLLSHRPELIETYSTHGIDLVLAGHAHGGQVRLPLIGGLYAPTQGAFPEYCSGLYEMNGSQMFVSRGLDNEFFPPRINNRPELAIITLEH